MIIKIQLTWQKELKNKFMIMKKLMEIWDKTAGEIIDQLKKDKQTTLAKKIIKIETQKKYKHLEKYLKQTKIDFIKAKEKWKIMLKEKNKSTKKYSCYLDFEKIDNKFKMEKAINGIEDPFLYGSQNESKIKVRFPHQNRKSLPYKRQRTLMKYETKKEVNKTSSKGIMVNFLKPIYSPFPKEDVMKEMILALASKM